MKAKTSNKKNKEKKKGKKHTKNLQKKGLKMEKKLLTEANQIKKIIR